MNKKQNTGGTLSASQHTDSWHASADVKVNLESDTHIAEVINQSVMTGLSKAGGLTLPPGSYTVRLLVLVA